MGIHTNTKSRAGHLLAGAAFSAMLLASPVAMAADDGVDADDVVAALAREGYPVDLGEDLFGDPEIESAMGDTLFDVLFFDCDGDTCDTITFSAVYVSDTVSLENVNQWNINTLHGQAYLDDEDDPNLDFTILAAGGLTDSNLRKIVRQWAVSLAEFEDHIGWTGNSGRGAAASGGAAVASASSTIDVCNNSGDGVSIAYATASGGTDSAGDTLFLSEGWLNVDDGECTDIWESPFENCFYYIYAEADDGDYSGDYFFCTLEDAFEIIDTQCTADFERNGFFQIDMSEGTRMQVGHTIELNP
ncbi:MAG: DUF1036 domain-containing protein [Rhodospirillaceae bacterium]|jgi:uncharacterized membrane protein|nr:DUF1036 domain-containing protein [Rhodospirillaceae bacterium]MBT6308422.1 DUF1036 domain-containing protein [Rhodospirillaceae bacterium]